MAYETYTVKPDDLYCIHQTGDCVAGDKIKFARAVFTGPFRKPKFSHFEELKGEILKESYGAKTAQHTFTVLLDSGETIRIKGRNLYSCEVYRQKWEDESKRNEAAKEKHERGIKAKRVRKTY